MSVTHWHQLQKKKKIRNMYVLFCGTLEWLQNRVNSASITVQNRYRHSQEPCRDTACVQLWQDEDLTIYLSDDTVSVNHPFSSITNFETNIDPFFPSSQLSFRVENSTEQIFSINILLKKYPAHMVLYLGIRQPWSPSIRTNSICPFIHLAEHSVLTPQYVRIRYFMFETAHQKTMNPFV